MIDIKDLTKIIPNRFYLVFPICFYESMTPEQRINYYKNRNGNCDIYFIADYMFKSQKLYKLNEKGELDEL